MAAMGLIPFNSMPSVSYGFSGMPVFPNDPSDIMQTAKNGWRFIFPSKIAAIRYVIRMRTALKAHGANRKLLMG